MLVLLIILWLLSPLALIPLTIIFSNRKSKLERFMYELLDSGRISRSEYRELKAEKKEASSDSQKTSCESQAAPTVQKKAEPTQASPVPVSESKPVIQPKTEPTSVKTDAPEVSSRPVFRDESASYSRKQPAPHTPSAPADQPASNKRAGAMSVLMTIGIIFVVLAGLVFSTAVWVNLGDFGRTCSIGIVAALFFGISAFVKKRLKLETTSFGFYTLGTFFSAITVITAGFFGLFGSFLTLNGGGGFIVFAAAALVICLLSAKGRSIFDRPAAAYISAFSGAISAVLLLVQLSDGNGMFPLLMALLTLAVNTAVFTFGINFPEKWEKPIVTASGVLYATALLSGAAAFLADSDFFIICAVIYAARAVLTAVLGFNDHAVYSGKTASAVSLLSGIFFAASLMWKLSPSPEIFALCISVFAVAFSFGFFTPYVHIPDEWKGSVKLSAILLNIVGIISALSALASDFGEWNGVCFAIAALYIISSFAVGIMAAYKHNVYGKTASAFTSLFTGMTFSVLLIAELSNADSAAALMLTVLFLVFVNAVYSVSCRLPEEWKIAVGVTASILGIISSLSSVFVLFDNYGEWNAVCYTIAALYIVQSIAVTVMAFMGHSEYSKARYAALSQLIGLSFTTMLLYELLPNGKCFILVFAILAVLFTTASHFLRSKLPDKWIFATKITKIILNGAAAFASAGMLIYFDIGWNAYCFITAALYILYTAAWGIYRKNSLLKAAECIVGSFTLYNIYYSIQNEYPEAPVFIFVLMLFAFALLHHFAKPLRTVFSDIFLTLAFVITAFIGAAEDIYALSICEAALAAVLLLVKSLEKERRSAAVYSVFLPIPIIEIVFNAVEIIGDSLVPYYYFPMCVQAAASAAVLAVTALVLSLRRNSGAAFYSFAISAAVMSLFAMGNDSVGIEILALAVTVLLTVLFCRSANNLPSLLTMAIAALAVNNIADIAEYSSGDWVHIFAAAVFSAVCLAASRVFFPNKLYIKKDGIFRLDTLCIGMLFSLPMLDFSDGRVLSFTALTILAVFTANFARKEHFADFNRAAVTAGCGIFTIALINRPFLVITDPLFSFKIALVLICLFGFAFSKIWKNRPKLAENFPSAVYGISFICLIVEALRFESLFNTLIVLTVSLVILMYSFMRKKKRWFAVSSIALTGLTLYIFKDFFLMIDWWVYLLAVGLLLIVIASANEYFIKKGRELKEKAGRFFEDWTW